MTHLSKATKRRPPSRPSLATRISEHTPGISSGCIQNFIDSWPVGPLNNEHWLWDGEMRPTWEQIQAGTHSGVPRPWMWFYYRPRPVHRLLWQEIAGEPLPSGIHVVKTCHHLNCVNPAHTRLKSVYIKRVRTPFPQKLLPASLGDEAVDECADMILMVDGSKLPPASLCARFEYAYDMNTINLALARIKKGKL